MVRYLQTGVCLALLVLSTSCGSKRPPAVPDASPTILDQLLQPEDVKALVRAAEQDLPSDEWRTGGETRPGRHNISRSGREGGLAQELLSQLKSRLQRMSARQLLDSLRTYPDGPSPTFPGVAYYIYRDGNQMIIKELTRRPSGDLESLREFRKDQRRIFTGDNGPPSDVGGIVRYTLLNEPL
jgi:hypothetical protein